MAAKINNERRADGAGEAFTLEGRGIRRNLFPERRLRVLSASCATEAAWGGFQPALAASDAKNGEETEDFAEKLTRHFGESVLVHSILGPQRRDARIVLKAAAYIAQWTLLFTALVWLQEVALALV